MLATVTTHLDIVDDNDGLVSLREAIEATVSGGTVDFSTNPAHNLNGATIELDETEGEMLIDGKSLTIDASMLTNGITIDAGDTTTQVGDGFRIFHITDPTSGNAPPLVTLIGLTLTGGDPSSSSENGNGGAIYSEARLAILDCTIEENEARSGGGIHIKVAGGSSTTPRNVLTIVDSVIQNNQADSGGGMFAGMALAA